ncbi:DNA polymerase III subunit beta [Dictyobacter kobayashii]|uniref:Beta sliding clamp n=1 Tax=Dictyobacter kobayashii TaxID=2014872 RepID=A0A402AGV0_9CHLR|nr:DNA polymerase III subunit beta [Dictyobacter kobayashii]GCE18326.1 DNA polymerase III subunit beta [Dictyobacter kobayashii]
MKITCKQQDLSRGLSIVSHAVSSRSTLPILANILLSTDQGRLKLSATNLEIGINCLIDAEVLEDGSTTVPAKTFTDLVNSLRQGQVELTVAEESHDVNVKSTGSNANIKGMDPSEFPLIPSAEGDEEPIILEAGLLKEMISQVVFAAADDDSRPVLTGVLVEVANEETSFAAADAFRLALRVAPLPGHTASHNSILIPARTLSELARILPSDGAVQMVVTPNRSQVLFHTEHIDLVSRLIEGTFPNIKAAIPKEHTTRAVVETKEFAAAVKTVTPFARDSSNITRIKISSGQGDEAGAGSLTLEATAEDIGNNITTINAAVDGPDQEIIFNVRYLGEVLGILDTPEVALEVTSAARPGVVKPVSAAEYIYVIMPMSTNR